MKDYSRIKYLLYFALLIALYRMPVQWLVPVCGLSFIGFSVYELVRFAPHAKAAAKVKRVTDTDVYFELAAGTGSISGKVPVSVPRAKRTKAGDSIVIHYNANKPYRFCSDATFGWFIAGLVIGAAVLIGWGIYMLTGAGI